MRFMGLDYGDKNIGVAISDELGIIAHGLDVIKKKCASKFDFEIKKIIEFVNEYKVNKIILGLPKKLDNNIGRQAEKTLVFKDCLNKNLCNCNSGIEILFWDERLSSKFMERNLYFLGLNSRKQKKVIDKMSAVFILQGYLDYINNKSDGDDL